MFTKESFLSFYKGTPNEKAAGDCYEAISRALVSSGIYSDLVLIGALATCRVEVGKAFLPIAEYTTGVQYEFRKDLGNTKLGDGVKYKGRGYIQLTGKLNYIVYGQKLGLDLVSFPELALQPTTAARILAEYFKDRGCDKACNDKNWGLVRKLVNGGTNGLDVFLSVAAQYLPLVTPATSNRKLEVTGIKIIKSFLSVSWTLYNNDGSEKESGAWQLDPMHLEDEVLAKAKTMVDPGIDVILNIK